jgi:hypothetical protein
LISLETAFKFPLQQGQLGVLNGLFGINGCKQDRLLAVDVGDATDGRRLVDADPLTLDTPQLCQGGFGRGGALPALGHNLCLNGLAVFTPKRPAIV